MVRLPTLILAVAAAGTLGFIGGAFTAAKRGWGAPLVSVVVENRTTSNVSLINLHHAGCGEINSLSVQNLQPGRTHTFRFLVCGEGGYKLDAMLENKMVLSSSAYVESGHKVVEVIEPLRIRSQTQAHPF
jgi:hypothetical protein